MSQQHSYVYEVMVGMQIAVAARCQFHQRSTRSFYTLRSKKPKKESPFLCFWDLHVQKLLLYHWWNWPLVSISSTPYEELLRTQIPKEQKNTGNLNVFLHFGGFALVKPLRKLIDEIGPRCEFHQHPTSNVCASRFTLILLIAHWALMLIINSCWVYW